VVSAVVSTVVLVKVDPEDAPEKIGLLYCTDAFAFWVITLPNKLNCVFVDVVPRHNADPPSLDLTLFWLEVPDIEANESHTSCPLSPIKPAGIAALLAVISEVLPVVAAPTVKS
jgi:hypothetical protein